MKRTTWTLIIAALLTSGLGLHVVVTRPLDHRIDSLASQVQQLQSGMRKVADYRDEVAGTNDLLSGLEVQSQRIDRAREAAENIRRLEREVQQQSQAAGAALDALTDIARLQSDVIAQGRRVPFMHESLDKLADYQQRVDQLTATAADELVDIDRAEESLRQLGNFHQRVAIESSGIHVAQNRFAGLVELKQAMEQVDPAAIDIAQQRLEGLSQLTQRVIERGVQAGPAQQAAGELIALQNQVIQGSQQTATARQHAEALIGLEQTLAGDAGQHIDAAQDQLAELSALAQHVIDNGQQAEQARQVAADLLALQDELVTDGTQIEVAHQHARQLLDLEQTLAQNAGESINAAQLNLAALLRIEEQLATQDERLATAIESLELLEDLQDEFHQRTHGLENIRRGLTELLMMESMIARTVRSLQPLTELADLRRIDAHRLRSIARTMIEDSQQRVVYDDTLSTLVEQSDSPGSKVESEQEQLVPLPPAE